MVYGPPGLLWGKGLVVLAKSGSVKPMGASHHPAFLFALPT